MKAILYHGAGDASVLRFTETERPDLAKSEIRIRVRASGLNRADLYQRRGQYPPPPGASEIPGLEVAGEVIECAPEVKRFHVGDRVMALLAGGGYAEEATVDEGLVLPVPDEYTFLEGAAVMETFLTAHHNLFTLGQAKQGERVLIHAGASGVGTSAIQLLKDYATVYATVGSKEKAALVEKLGATPVLYKTEKWETRFLEPGSGIDVALDPVGAKYLPQHIEALSTNGRLIVIGLMGGREAVLDLGLLLTKRLTVRGSTLRALPLEDKRAIVKRFEEAFFEKLKTRIVAPVIDQVFPASQVADAQGKLERAKNAGKVVIEWHT